MAACNEGWEQGDCAVRRRSPTAQAGVCDAGQLAAWSSQFIRVLSWLQTAECSAFRQAKSAARCSWWVQPCGKHFEEVLEIPHRPDSGCLGLLPWQPQHVEGRSEGVELTQERETGSLLEIDRCHTHPASLVPLSHAWGELERFEIWFEGSREKQAIFICHLLWESHCANTANPLKWMEGLHFFTQCCCLSEHGLTTQNKVCIFNNLCAWLSKGF